MSAVLMWQGLEERFKTISGLTNILLGEPTSIQDTPALCTVLDRFERATTGQVTTMRYFFAHRLIIPWQDNPEAEMQLLTLLNAIPASIDASPMLGGRIVQGMAKITVGNSSYVPIGKTLYRVCDFTSDIKENGDVRSGI